MRTFFTKLIVDSLNSKWHFFLVHFKKLFLQKCPFKQMSKIRIPFRIDTINFQQNRCFFLWKKFFIIVDDFMIYVSYQNSPELLSGVITKNHYACRMHREKWVAVFACLISAREKLWPKWRFNFISKRRVFFFWLVVGAVAVVVIGWLQFVVERTSFQKYSVRFFF